MWSVYHVGWGGGRITYKWEEVCGSVKYRGEVCLYCAGYMSVEETSSGRESLYCVHAVDGFSM